MNDFGRVFVCLARIARAPSCVLEAQGAHGLEGIDWKFSRLPVDGQLGCGRGGKNPN